MTIPLYPDAIAYVATEQMLEVDRAMMEDYRIELIQMMESAGRNLAHIARVRFLDGYRLKGAPRGTADDLIRWANAQLAPILALDVPSGVDTTTRTVFDPAIKATAIMTLALPKAGLRAPGVETQIGELYLADISVPLDGVGLGTSGKAPVCSKRGPSPALGALIERPFASERE